MRNITRTAILMTATFLAGTPLMAEGMTPTDIAQKYYLALYSGENDTVREMAAADKAFQDPSAPEAYGVPVLNAL